MVIILDVTNTKHYSTKFVLFVVTLIILFILLNVTIYLGFYIPDVWAELLSLIFLFLWPMTGLVILHRGNIHIFRLKVFLKQCEIIFVIILLLLLLFALFIVSFDLIVKVFLKLDISSILTVYVNTIPFSLQVILLDPLVEEISKIIPLFVVGYPFVNKFKKYKFIDLRSESQIIFYGLVTGSIFIIFEFLSYFFIITGQDPNQFTRLLNPLHILTTVLLSIGVYYFFKSSDSEKINIRIAKLLPFLFLSWFLHSFYNALPLISYYYVVQFYGTSINFAIINLDNNIFNFLKVLINSLLTLALLLLLFFKSKSLKN